VQKIILEKSWLKYSLMIFVFTLLFLFSPKPKTSIGTYCGEYIHLNKMGFVLFCDSYQYTYLTTNPSLMLDSNFVAVRQNRPLYIYIAHVIGLPIKFAVDKIVTTSFFESIGGNQYLHQPIINTKLKSSPFLKKYNIQNQENLVLDMLPFYMAYIILNFMVLLASLILLEKLLKQLKVDLFIIHFLSLFIVSSGIVKAFFYSAHEQMFTFFTPLFVAYSMLLLIRKRLNSTSLLFITFLNGILCLAYGSFILYFPCMVLAMLIMENRIFPSLDQLKIMSLNALVFVIPTFSWIFICHHFSGHYYNGEISNFREFVWVIDTMSIGFSTFIKTASSYSLRYLHTILLTLIPFVVGLLFLFNKSKSIKISSEYSHFFLYLKWMVALFFFFFWVLGYYNFRLTYTLVPILLLIIAILLQTLLINKIFLKETLRKNLLFLSIVWIVWSVLKYGPFPFQ